MSTINDTYNRVNEIETRGREIACAALYGCRRLLLPFMQLKVGLC